MRRLARSRVPVDDRRRRRTAWAAIVFGVAFVVPLYLACASLAVRAGLLQFGGGPTWNDAQFKAVLAFLAAVFATTATIVGIRATNAHNQREHTRQKLETAARGLELMTAGDGYAPPARVAGGLAILLHLDHPVIAIRALASAWDDAGTVDDRTAVWLISEVFRVGTPAAQLEAARLLRERAPCLTRDAGGENRFYWPHELFESWPVGLPLDARINNLIALYRLLLSKDIEWWQRAGLSWVAALLDEVVQCECTEPVLRGEAVAALEIVLRVRGPVADRLSWRSGWKSVPAINERMRAQPPASHAITALSPFREQLAAWADPTAPVSHDLSAA